MNFLLNETSPYLLQHAHNPVQWYPWGEEALERARAEDKPILVSIGYAACHWCHVMERESFEDPATAAIMNQHFINIKIDREERPDLDHIYMDAVQSMTGSGGWPLNVFLTPQLQPFYGGTYFPPRPVHNRNSWTQILEAVARGYAEKKEQVLQQAAQLTAHLQQANSFGQRADNDPRLLFTAASITDAVGNIMKTADRRWGGFSQAPKFPQTFTIQFLLRASNAWQAPTQEADLPKSAQEQALLSIDAMLNGGIYDHLGGGLARYSTDQEWLAPHFEKMLYDNALLLSTLSEAFQITRSPHYREAMKEIIGFVQREMMDAGGGFYAALDADSEGEEGRYYVWSLEEIETLLGEEAPVFCRFYDVSAKGNWEEKNILRIRVPLEEFAVAENIDPLILNSRLNRCRAILLEARSKRVRPQLDDKVILGWNALFTTALCKAHAATGETAWLELALQNMNFLLNHFREDEGAGYHHTWKNGRARIPAFLDDYAWLIQALVQLHEVSGQRRYLDEAARLADHVIAGFSDEEGRYFYFTPLGQPDILVRKKEVYDGATPSGNAIMAENLYRLSLLLDRPEWRERAESMLLALGQAMVRYPTSFGCWNMLLLEMVAGTAELAVVGEGFEKVRTELLAAYLPHKILLATETADSSIPLLSGKAPGRPAWIYVCRDYTCQAPVSSTREAISLINRPA